MSDLLDQLSFLSEMLEGNLINGPELVNKAIRKIKRMENRIKKLEKARDSESMEDFLRIGSKLGFTKSSICSHRFTGDTIVTFTKPHS